MDKNRAIEKIKKCLSLAESSNPHEAAAAIRQARLLMEKFQITEAALELMDIAERKVKADHKRPPAWASLLVGMVGHVFGCQVIHSRAGDCVEWCFIGEGVNPELAAYAYEVLKRSLTDAKQAYQQEERARWYGPLITSSEMADKGRAFAEGWVIGVGRNVAEFAKGVSPDAAQRIEAWQEQRGLKVKEAKPVKSAMEKAKYAAGDGFRAGEKVSIHQAMPESHRPQRLADAHS